MERDRKKIIILVIVGVILVSLCAGLLWYFLHIDRPEDGYILENVSVAGVAVGGMHREEAAAMLTDDLLTEFAQGMAVTLPDGKVTLPAQIADANINIEKLIEDIYALGRNGSRRELKQQILQAETTGFDVSLAPYLTLDTGAIRQWCEDTAKAHSSDFSENIVELVGEKPVIEEALADTTGQILKITVGSPERHIDPDALYNGITKAYAERQFEIGYACAVTEPTPIDLDALYKEYCFAPVDAVMDPETFAITPHSLGYGFDLEQANSMLQNAAPGDVLEIPLVVIAPEITTESLSAALYPDVLGSYTANASSIWGRDINLNLSCQAINGIVLLPGEVFSYNPALGERTPDKGWQKADGYIGNATVSEYGGGICQASSCLYLSAMLADLEIVERVNHGFISSYMPYGMDATVSWGGPEFLFRNSTAYPIKIEASASGGSVTVKLLGTDTKDYYVKMDYEVLDVYPFKTVTKEMTADNPDGYKDGQVIVTPYTGYKIATYRCKYDKQTDELISRDPEVVSRYSYRDRVVCKIVESEPPTETIPPETTPPETTVPPETTESTVPAEAQQP